MSAGDLSVYGEWLVQEANGCTCQGSDAHYGHQSGCGYEPLLKVEELKAALKGAGFVVIALPEPDADIGPYFDAGNGAIAHADGERVRLHSFARTEGRHGGTWFTPAQARSTAAALLAAAEASS